MLRTIGTALCVGIFGLTPAIAQPATAPTSTGLTIYNQDFAVVRTPVTLNLHAGTTEVSQTNVTAQVEPDSVVLRNSATHQPIPIIEQNYDGALRIQAQMLAKFEGKTVDFAIGTGDNVKIVPGKIVRAGFVPQYDLLQRYGQNYFYQNQQQAQQQEPLIEMEGKLRYGLPGTPLFPSETPGLTLRPTLTWLIPSDKPAKVAAELDYITRGLRWDASYNVIAPSGDAAASQKLEMVGWVNVTNESGTDFQNAALQLMAGDISKLTNMNGPMAGLGGAMQVVKVVVVEGLLRDLLLHAVATLQGD